MNVNEEHFETYDPRLPPEHRCSEGTVAEATKTFLFRIFLLPIPQSMHSLEFQPHIVVTDGDGHNICGINTDFCPYCGTDLTNRCRTLANDITIETKPITREYFSYRRRFVESGKSGKNIAPMREGKWATTAKRLEETVMMHQGAKEEHKPQLVQDMKEMIELLCLSGDSLKNYPALDVLTPNPNDTE